MFLKVVVTTFSFISLVVGSPPLSAQSPIPIRELVSPTAKSHDQFGAILGIRELPGGRVLVNDGRRRQLVVLDASLANKTVVVDSASTGGQAYGPRSSPIVPYLGDSTLFVDAASSSLLVLSPTGVVVRVVSAPKPTDLFMLSSSASGVDAKGNLVYRGREPYKLEPNAPPPDSLPVVRANFETRAVDTLGRVKDVNKSRFEDRIEGGRTVAIRISNPLNTPDEWAILSDGTIAFVRGHDYHVDLLRPDGKLVNGPKLAFDWKRLSDADKQALIDSARAFREALESGPNGTPISMSSSAIAAAANGGARLTVANQPKFLHKDPPLSELADYWPPIRSGAAKADLDANLWILPTTSAQSRGGELVYDVVNNLGVMTQRVRIPLGRSIAGFGKGGVVYLMYREANAGWVLERTTIARAVRPM